MRNNKCVRLLAYITGLVNQRLLLQCEYLIAENRVLRSHVTGRLPLSDAERSTLAEIAKRLGRRHLAEVACAHMAVLSGTDFFTVEVLTWRGLVTYYVLFFLHLESRRVTLGGITRHPTEAWITQMARNAVDETSGGLRGFRYLLHDRDTKFCAGFDEVLAGGGIPCLRLPPRSPNLKAYASYCTSSRLCDGENRLLGPSASVALENRVSFHGFV